MIDEGWIRCLSYLGSRDLGRTSQTSRKFLMIINHKMVNCIPVSDLHVMIEKSFHQKIRCQRKLIACELIENYKLGFQSSSGLALWKSFKLWIHKVAERIKKAPNVKSGLRICQEEGLCESVCWLAVHARLCFDFIHTDWFLVQEDLIYLASQDVLFAPEFIWHGDDPIACLKHSRSPIACPNLLVSENVALSRPPSMKRESSFSSTVRLEKTETTVQRIQTVTAQTNLRVSSDSHCLFCHPLAFLTQRCVFDIIPVLRRTEQLTLVPEIIAIIKYAGSFLPHLATTEQRKVLRLIIIHLIKRFDIKRVKSTRSHLSSTSTEENHTQIIIQNILATPLAADEQIVNEIMAKLHDLKLSQKTVSTQWSSSTSSSIDNYFSLGSSYVITES